MAPFPKIPLRYIERRNDSPWVDLPGGGRQREARFRVPGIRKLQPDQVGDCFYDTRSSRHGSKQFAEAYMQGARKVRPPIVVVLPTRDGRGIWFWVDSRFTRGGVLQEGGWVVTGDITLLNNPYLSDAYRRRLGRENPPGLNAITLTVEPSIHIVGIFHGYVRNGMIETLEFR